MFSEKSAALCRPMKPGCGCWPLGRNHAGPPVIFSRPGRSTPDRRAKVWRWRPSEPTLGWRTRLWPRPRDLIGVTSVTRWRPWKGQGWPGRKHGRFPGTTTRGESVCGMKSPTGNCLGQSLPRYDHSTVASSPDRIPPRFWCLFWSGLDPMFIRPPEHAWYVASRMLAPKGSWRHLPAETWALQHLPARVLEKLLESRGYADGPVAERIRLAISRAAVV